MATRQIIKTGTTVDDGTGDLLRDAFNKVNTNFENIWEKTSVNSELDFTDFTITSTGDLLLSPANDIKATKSVIFNENKGNFDFTVHGDTSDNVLFIDASTNRVGILNNTPTVALDVTGDVAISGGLTVGGTTTLNGNTVLGSDPTDIISYTGRIGTNVEPYGNQTLGTTTNRWNNGFFTNLDVTGSISGTISGSIDPSITLTNPINSTTITTDTLTATTSAEVGNLLVTGTLAVQGATTTIDSATIQIVERLTFEGATADDFETSIVVTDPTADRTITLPDASGTVALTSEIETRIDAHILTSTATAGQVLSWDGSDFDWVTPGGGGGGIALTDLSVGAEDPASGDGGIAYDDSTGVFTYTPPDLSGYQPTSNVNADIDAHLNQSGPTDGYVLSWTSGDYAWVSNAGGGGIALTDLSVGAEGTASGDGAIAYDDSTGIFTYTPPDLSTYLTSVSESDVTAHQAALSITESQISDLGTYQTVAGLDGAIDTHLNQSNPTSGYVLSWNGSDYAWVANGAGGGLSNIVEDTTPQLGGNLDAQTFDITTTGKVLFANVYATTGDLPSASTYHGMFAHVHGTGKGYFAHAGNWIELANASELSTVQLITQGDSAVTVTDTGTDGNVEFKTDNTVRWNIDNSGHLLPEANATYDIGSATNKVRDLYLDANSLHIGSVDISESGGKLVMPAQELSGHLIPDTNATYDLGSAEYKIRHLFLSDNSLKFVNSSNTEFSLGVNATGNKLEYNSETVSTSSYETNDTAGAIDITKRHHFISGGVNYTLADGTYTGQELHFWRSAVGVGYSDITIANAKWTIPGDTTDARTNFVWRTNGANAADNRTFMAVWDGAGWCLSGGTVAA